MKNFIKFTLISVLFVAFLAGCCHPLYAYVMESQSGDYRIESDDSLTPTGGLGVSANYIFKDTMGEVSSGVSNSTLYKIKAGFQEMQEVSLSVTPPDDTALTPNIPGISGGTADASTHWIVQTDGSSGFDMKISTSTLPALKLPPDGTYYFTDYSNLAVPFWDIGSDAAKFGFNVVAATAGDAPAFQDNGSVCGSGTNVGNCWSGLNGTTPVAVIHRMSRTDETGENETISFKAQSNKFLESGDYSALVTVTVASN
jgi:hypothetical protein